MELPRLTPPDAREIIVVLIQEAESYERAGMLEEGLHLRMLARKLTLNPQPVVIDHEPAR